MAKRKTTKQSNPRYLISRDGVEVGYYPGFTSVEAIKRAKMHYGAGKYTAEKVDAHMYIGRGAERTQARERRERQEAHHAERMEMAKGRRNPGMDVANIIYQQLGGARFAQMTGAKNFLGDKNSLRFKLPKNQSQANLVTITLEANDTYTISFAQYRGNNVKVLKEIDMVYADQLREIFERYTGLYTSLGTMKHRPNGHWRNGTHIHAEKIDHLDVAKVHNPELDNATAQTIYHNANSTGLGFAIGDEYDDIGEAAVNAGWRVLERYDVSLLHAIDSVGNGFLVGGDGMGQGAWVIGLPYDVETEVEYET